MRRPLALFAILLSIGIACLGQARSQFVPMVGFKQPAAAVGAVTKTFNGTVSGGPSFLSVSLGAAATGRVVVVALASSLASSGTVNAGTIGGISATRLSRGLVAGSASHNLTAELWAAVVPTGTTGNVVFSVGGTTPTMAIGVYSLYGANATPTGTNSGTGFGVSASASVTVPTNGVGLGAAFCNSASGNVISWTNLTVDASLGWTANAALGAASTSTTGAATRTETCSGSGNQMVALAAYGP